MNHFNYFKYIIRHKWFVFLACRRFKVGLWQSIIHDCSKFFPHEWFPYVHTFYAKDGSRQYIENADFEYAWNHHQKINLHHWQYWILTFDRGNEKILPMPTRYIREMIADWAGAGKAITGKWEFVEWYNKNKINIKLHKDTRFLVEQIINTESTELKN